MRYEYISWSRFYRLCGTLYRRIEAAGFRPETILAIERGGYPIARVLADYFDVMDLIGLKVEHYRGPDKLPQAVIPYPLGADLGGKRVLVVDDVSDSGDTFNAVLPHILERGEPTVLRTAVLHHKQTSSYRPDFHAQRVIRWRWITYPWALVEDLTVLASRFAKPPRSVAELRSALRGDTGFRLPDAVFAQVGPIVLERLAEVRRIPPSPARSAARDD
jgi:hypoxanthine phosphoribosyltransferase